uniref:Uncharacterized protein n=1 Tax=Lepeophtheirus salmonis TaxID=72036 RepID=A0A0K2SX94_LEPSM
MLFLYVLHLEKIRKERELFEIRMCLIRFDKQKKIKKGLINIELINCVFVINVCYDIMLLMINSLVR